MQLYAQRCEQRSRHCGGPCRLLHTGTGSDCIAVAAWAMATSAAEAFASAAALHVDESRQAAPIDVRAWGLVVDPQRALFTNGHLAVALVCLVQCGAIAAAIGCCLPGRASVVRKRVLEYCVATAVFSAAYAFTGHTWVSNLLAVWHNHTEVQLIAVALVARPSWRKYHRLSLLYSVGYAVVTMMASVKNSRRVWTMVGIVWDGMLPLAFAARYLRSRRAPLWVPGFWAAVFHLVSITVLLTMVDGFAQWFSLLLPPTFVALGLFVVKWERHDLGRLAGLGGLTAGAAIPAPDDRAEGHPSKAKASRTNGGGPTGNARQRSLTLSQTAGALPDRVFVYLWVGVVFAAGLPMAGILYGPRAVSAGMAALRPLLPEGAIAA